jgi:hypothetical protein
MEVQANSANAQNELSQGAKQARSIVTLENYFLKQIIQFLCPQDIVKLSLISKEMRNRLRTVMLREMKLDYSDSKWRINKNFFNVLKNNYSKKIIKLSQEDFASFIREPNTKAIKPIVKSFFPGSRIVKTKVGPKAVGILTDTGKLTLMLVEDFDKLHFEGARAHLDVANFEVNGWCVIENSHKSLFYTQITKEHHFSPLAEIAAPQGFKPSNLVTWSSSFDKIAAVYRQSALVDENIIAVFSQSAISEPTIIKYKGDIKQICLAKFKMYLIDVNGDLHIWDIADQFSHSAVKGERFSKVFSNSLLSFLFCRDNRAQKLETMTADQVGEWLSYLGLDKFNEVAKYSKIDGKRFSTFTPENFEQLFGLPYDCPEVNHLVLHNKLLQGDYYKNPELTATGYNGNNELGLNTGNNIIQDFQDFTLKLHDNADDVKEIKIGGTTTFLSTLKNRLFTCYDPPEEQKDNEGGRKGSEAKHHSSGSDEDDEEEENDGNKGKGGKKNKKAGDGPNRKNSKAHGDKGKEKGSKVKKDKAEAENLKAAAGPRYAKKFEKNKWKEISELFKKNPKLRDYHVDWLESTKAGVFLICHEKHKMDNEEVAKDRLVATGIAVQRLLKDPKLNTAKYMAGIKNSKFDIDEMPVEKYLLSDIPEHWVMYLRHADSMKIVWDRRDYTELLDDLDIIL